jgi:predicted DNA-binding transcriptional regulator AlpA
MVAIMNRNEALQMSSIFEAAETPSVADRSFADDRVLTLAEAAHLTGLSIATFRRLLREERGPAVTTLSPRRLGVRVKHLRQWLDGRTRPAT